MFFFWATVSMIGYGLHGFFLAHFARRIDPLVCAAHRGFALWFCMAPLLIFVEKNQWAQAVHFLAHFALVGFLGAVGFAFSLAATRFLPVGILSAFQSAVRVVLVCLGGFIFFGESLSFWQGICIGLILLCGFFLSVQKFTLAHLGHKSEKGFLLATAGALAAATWWIFGAKISREISPFLFAFLGEWAVGFMTIVLVLLRVIFLREKIERIAKVDFWKIFAISTLTLFGTGGFFLAAALGPVGIVVAIGSGSILVAAIAGHFFFREKLKVAHWLAVMGIFAGIFGLKMF